MQVGQSYSYETDLGDVQGLLEVTDTESSEEDTKADSVIHQSLLDEIDSESSEEDTCLNSVIKKCSEMGLKIRQNTDCGAPIGLAIGVMVSMVGVMVIVDVVEKKNLVALMALIVADLIVPPVLGAIVGGGIQLTARVCKCI